MALKNKQDKTLALRLAVSQIANGDSTMLSVNMTLTPYEEVEGTIVFDDDGRNTLAIMDAVTSTDPHLLTALAEVEAAIQKYITAKEY
jgi:hypothetical protein